MRDPHVVSLKYKLETVPTVTFNNSPVVREETDEFRLSLENGEVTVELKEHFPSIDAARTVIDSFLRAWELDVALQFGREEIKFIFVDAEVVDRDPPPPGSPQRLEVANIGSVTAFGEVTVSVHRSKYPLPPKDFRASADVEALWYRYDMYLQGREPLLDMGYFCFTWLTVPVGGIDSAVNIYRIHRDVLRKLSELTSTRGDEKTARKRDRGGNVPLTNSEKLWIEATVKAIIRRVGEISANPLVGVLTMNDLPAL